MAIDVDELKGIYTFAATIVGAGILALPIFLGSVGFLPGALMIILIGAACIFSALFIMETYLRSNESLYLPGLCHKFLGKKGFYLMFLGILIYIYGALIGYLSAGGQILYEISQGRIPVKIGILIYFLAGTLIIYFGIKVIKSVSTVLFILMLLLFFGIVILVFPHSNFDLLKFRDWGALPATFGILLFAFTGHTILPSLAEASAGKPRVVRNIAFWGTVLPLILYLVWFFAILSVVPYGKAPLAEVNPLSTKTLTEAGAAGQPATIPLAHLIGGQILILAVFFSLFSTFTSFLGFGISLRDSFSELKIKRTLALILTVLPPLFFAFWQPTYFLKVLDFAGFYGAGIFVGILPALMVLKAREKKEKISEFITPGGNIVPWFIFFAFLFGLVYKTLGFFIKFL